MRRAAGIGWAVSLVLVSGCAGVSPAVQLVRDGEAMCKCCNCLMRVEARAEGICPICNCGHPAHQCVRGR